ncbi:MAG: hypothetical protein DWQ02_12655 [Bacteroidetes bacterium]|nr:MAG: hypothetical protein DWQ02_12655 [Bacteroidota bacterium]
MKNLFISFFFIFCTTISHSQVSIVSDGFPVFDLAINQSGDLLVFTKNNGIELWNLDKSVIQRSWKDLHRDKIISLDFSNSGDWIVTGGRDGISTICQINQIDSFFRLEGQEGIISAVQFSPNDRIVGTASSDGSIFIWDTSTGKEVSQIKVHKKHITAIEFLDNETFVSTDNLGNIILYDLKTQKVIKKLFNKKEWIRDLEINIQEKELLSCSNNGKIKVWDISKKKQVYLKSEKRKTMDWILSIDLNEDNYLAFGGMPSKITIDAPLETYTKRVPETVTKVLFLPNKTPFCLIYSTLERGIYLLKAEEMTVTVKR